MKHLLIFMFMTIASCTHLDSENDDPNPVVTTPLGQIKGSLLSSQAGKPIYAFRGIRYAEPPVENLRFQAPVPVKPWDGIYNATKDGPVCPQPSTDPVSEDCLMLNVYTIALPEGKSNPKNPVIVYLHAGGFYAVSGISPWAGPQYLLDEGVVLVTINYRLATLGFLSIGGKEAPGNNGLKDQVQALRWVKQNIAHFGGDPDSVTIMGNSAGSASVTLHIVSPMSQGLFHKAIAMSGSSFGNWPVPYHQLDLAKKQGRLIGCPDNATGPQIVSCLKTKPAYELGNTLVQFGEFGADPILLWLPVIEEDFGQEIFLPDHPTKLLMEGKYNKVPVLTGIAKEELSFVAFAVLGNDTLTQKMQNNWREVAPIAFIYERDTENSKFISDELRKAYFGNKPVNNSTFTELAQLYADGVIGFGVNRAAKILSENNFPVYYYRFNCRGRYSHFYLPDSNGTIPWDVVHQDDLIYLFYVSKVFPLFKDTDPELETVKKLTKMWANFARTGKPIPVATEALNNIEWPLFNMNTQQYMDIGTKIVVREQLYENRYAVWDKLFPLSDFRGP